MAKKRIYLRAEEGGLGLYDLKQFLCAQQCAWVKRAITLDEIWKIKIYCKSLGCVSNVKLKFFDRESEPVISGIIESFEEFANKFTCYKENFWKSKILENKALVINLREKNYLTIDHIDPEIYGRYKDKLLTLTIEDLYNCNKIRIKTQQQILNDLNMEIPIDIFENLKKICNNAKTKYLKQKIDEKKSENLLDFLNKKTKGSKRFRNILLPPKNPNIPHNMIKFANSTETIINIYDSTTLNSYWNLNYLSNSTRVFLFKLHNNTAGYNTAVSHFVRGHSEYCTFCTLTGNPELNREDPLHLFFQCVCSERVIDRTFTEILGEPINVTRQEYFVTFTRFTRQKNECLTLISKLILKYLWDCKVRETIPNAECCKLNLIFELKCISAINKDLSFKLANCGIDIETFL